MVEIFAAVVALINSVVLATHHFWTRSQLKRGHQRDDFRRCVEEPLNRQLEGLAEFSADVTDWEHGRSRQTESTIQSSGNRVSRKLNQAVNRIASSEFSGRADWLALKTEDLDESLRTDLNPDTIRNEVYQLENKILSAIKEARIR